MIEFVGVSVPRGGAVSIGEVLHDARSRLGLSIHEVARRTGIVEETIWAIELDDFAKCGEDFYARSYISVIAAVVRVDAAPLIAEFDAAHAPAGGGNRSELLTLPAPTLPSSADPVGTVMSTISRGLPLNQV